MKLEKTCDVSGCFVCRAAVRTETTIIDRHGIVHTEEFFCAGSERSLIIHLVRDLKRACEEMGMDDTEWWDDAQLSINEAVAFLKELK